jgi:osmotically-inducible protein OsmY
MKSDEELQKNVVDAINWEPFLKATEIVVIANKGMVTLTGSVNTYAKKAEAEQAAKNVAGVKTVIEEIKVVLNSKDTKTDSEILRAIEAVFKWHWDIPTEKISVIVENGWVFLSGELEWNYQKEATKNALINLIGIKGISNNISIFSLSKEQSKKKTLK